MISITFMLRNTPEDKAVDILNEVGIVFVKELGKIVPFPFAPPALGATFRRIGTISGEPAVSLLSRGLEHYVWAGATAIDTAPYKMWSFDIQCPNHSIAIPDRNTSKFHILKSNQVSTLFSNVALALSQVVDVEVAYNDDHARHGVNFQHGTPTKDEHW
jgi:hypothetical protein